METEFHVGEITHAEAVRFLEWLRDMKSNTNTVLPVNEKKYHDGKDQPDHLFLFSPVSRGLAKSLFPGDRVRCVSYGAKPARFETQRP